MSSIDCADCWVRTAPRHVRPHKMWPACVGKQHNSMQTVTQETALPVPGAALSRLVPLLATLTQKGVHWAQRTFRPSVKLAAFRNGVMLRVAP